MNKALGDISNVNSNPPTVTINDKETVSSQDDKNKKTLNCTYASAVSNMSLIPFDDINYEQESMDVGNNTTTAYFDEESCLQKTMMGNNTCIDYSYLPQQTFMNITVNKSKEEDQSDATMTDQQTEQVTNNDMDNNNTETNITYSKNGAKQEMSVLKHKNMTYDLIDQSNMTSNQTELVNQTTETEKKSNVNSTMTYGTLKSQTINDLTRNEIDLSLGTTTTANNFNNLTCTIAANNLNNETKTISNNTLNAEAEKKDPEVVETTPIISIADLHPKHIDFSAKSTTITTQSDEQPAKLKLTTQSLSAPANLNLTTNKETTSTGLRDFLNRSNLNNMSHLNATIDLSSISFLEIPKAQTFSLNGINLDNIQSFGDALKDHLESELNKMKNLKAKLKECEKMMQSKHEESLSNKKKAEKESNDLSKKLSEMREKVNKLKLNSSQNKESIRLFNYEPERYDKLQTGIYIIMF